MMEKDAISMSREAAQEIERLQKRNELLESQIWVIRIMEKALNAGSGGYGLNSASQWSVADRLKIFANELEKNFTPPAAGGTVEP